MAKHRETASKKQELYASLRHSCESGQLAPGTMLPPLSELSQQAGLSHGLVHQVLQQLVREGLLYTIPRSGTFVGQPPARQEAPLLLLSRLPRERHIYVHHLLNGFEDRVAQENGTSHALDVHQVARLQETNGELPEISGLFVYSHLDEPAVRYWHEKKVPIVRFGPPLPEQPALDYVDFDHLDGGRQATRRLLGMGHRNIAFLGLEDGPDTGQIYNWSRGRAEGWRQTITEAGQDSEGLCFMRPALPPIHSPLERSQMYLAAVDLVRAPYVTAVVAANELAVTILVNALVQSGRPQRQWPAIIGFDDPRNPFLTQGISRMRLPWDQVGAEAASLLRARMEKRLQDSPQRRLVKMRLVASLSCRPAWVTDCAFSQAATATIAEDAPIPATLDNQLVN